jgi:mannose-6-phosphate isomerase-like protein (cupin superfamily)
MDYKAINFHHKYKLFKNTWSPKVIAEMNDYQFKLVKIKGDFKWHSHKNTDEAFIVIQGSLKIKFKDGHVDLKEGEMFVVPRGVEHLPCADKEAKIMLIEPKGVVNTGDLTKNELTAKNDVWI